MLKYEDNLCGKVDFLHDHFKYNIGYHKELIELIDKIKKAYLSFSTSLKNIYVKKYSHLENKSSIFYQLFLGFIEHLKIESQEYKDLSDKITNQLTESLNLISNLDKKEDTLYKEFTSLRKEFRNSNSKFEEKKKIYNKKMEETEKAINELKSIKVNSLTPNYEILQKEDAISQCINSTKIDEQKYIKLLKETNTLINNVNSSEKDLLQFYQNNDKKILESIKNNNYCLIFVYMKEISIKIVNDIETRVQQYIKLDINKEIKTFIDQNKTNSLQLKNLEFIPYKPSSSLENSLKSTSENELMNINYEVLSVLQKEFKDICADIDMGEEKKRKNMRVLCLNLFDEKNSNFTEQNKNELISYMKNKEYRQYFIKTLTNQRTNGKFKRKEKIFNEILDILNFILDLAEKEQNYENAKNCIILSQTFYTEKEIDDETNEKHYLMDYIKKHKWLSKVSFWHELIEFDIKKEEKKYEEEKAKKIEEGKKIGEISNMYFSIILTFSTNMNMFGFPKNEAIKIVNSSVEKCKLSDNMKEILLKNIEDIYDKKRMLEKEKDRIVKKPRKKDYEDDWVFCDLDEKENENENKNDKKNVKKEEKIKKEGNKDDDDDNKNEIIDVKNDIKEEKKDDDSDNKNIIIKEKIEIKDEKNDIKEEKKENTNNNNINEKEKEKEKIVVKTDEELLNEEPLKINEFTDDKI